MRQVLFPSAEIWRRRMSSSSRSISCSAHHSAAGSGSNVAQTTALSAPVRTSSRVTLPPRTAYIASTRIDLPAPVSPVRILSPEPKDTSARSITAIFSICSSLSMQPSSLRAVYSIPSISRQNAFALSASFMISRAVSSPASVPTRLSMCMLSIVDAAALARPGRVLMTMMFCAAA